MAQKTTELEIINVGSPTFTKTPRGGYNSIEIAYKNLSFDGKVEGKKLVDFNDKAVFAFIKDLKNGDKVTITQEKNEGDQYWKWVRATLSDETGVQAKEPQPQAEGDTAPAGKSTGGRVVGNSYAEKNEIDREKLKFERQKHRQIGRQGCINSAVNILTAQGDVSVAGVLHIAAELEKYVFDTEVPF
jgi:hypothetical protein